VGPTCRREKKKKKKEKEEQREGVRAKACSGWFWAPGTAQFGLVPSSSLFFVLFLFLIFSFPFLSQILHIESKQG
jgi:hypothetical protein